MATLVVGVDPSPAGRKAMAFALREALVRGAELVAVRAWAAPTYALNYPVASVVEEFEQDETAHALRLAEDEVKLAADAVPGASAVPCRAVAVRGPAAQALVDAAQHAELLVVGSRGAHALSRAVLGSVSAGVLHHAAVPVAVVPATARLGTGVARVVVGVDHSPQSRQALRRAVDEATLHAATLVPVHVDQQIVTGEKCVDLAALEPAERASLRAAAVAAGASDTSIEPEVVIGHPVACLEQLARPDDLIVVASRGRGGFAGLLLGSTSSQLAAHATAPVLVVRGT